MKIKIGKRSVTIKGVQPNENGCIFEFDKQVELNGLVSDKVFAGWDVIVSNLFGVTAKPKKEKKNGKK